MLIDLFLSIKTDFIMATFKMCSILQALLVQFQMSLQAL